MRVLITGGGGFIGSNLVDHLERSDPETDVVVLDDFSTGDRSNLAPSRARIVEGSLVDGDAVADAASGADAIVHLGAVPSVPRSIADPRRSHDANITGTLNVLEAARRHGISHVIAASSSSVYGSNPALPKSEDMFTRPMSPYAVTKLATEAYLVAYGHSYGLRTLAFRFFNVYGPRQSAGHDYAAVIPRFIDAALAGVPLQVEGDGLQSRDFTYVDSVCDAIHRALQSRLASSSPVNLAFGTRTTLMQLIAMIEEATGAPVTIEHRAARVGDVRESQADTALLKSLLPDLAPVPLERGVQKTVEWFRAEAARGR